jgi:hypothetical protein
VKRQDVSFEWGIHEKRLALNNQPRYHRNGTIRQVLTHQAETDSPRLRDWFFVNASISDPANSYAEKAQKTQPARDGFVPIAQDFPTAGTALQADAECDQAAGDQFTNRALRSHR